VPDVTVTPRTVDVATPVGLPPRRRFRHVLSLELPTEPAGDPPVVDPSVTRLRARFEPLVYDALAAGPLQAAVTSGNGATIVTLDAPRTFGEIELTSGASLSQPLRLHRVDGTVLSVEATVTATRIEKSARYTVQGAFVDGRVGLRQATGAALPSGRLKRLSVRSDPAGVGIAVTAGDAIEAAVPFWRASEPSVTEVDVTSALADAVRAAVPDRAAPWPGPLSLALVVTAEAPMRFVLEELVVGHRLTDRGFAPLPLHRSDLADPDALVTMLRVPRDPVATHLRSLLTPAVRARLDGGDATSAALLDRLLADLSLALETEDLYDPDRFAGVALPADLGVLASTGPVGERRVRVNRLLLEAAQPDLVLRRTERRVLASGGPVTVGVRRPVGVQIEEATLTTLEDLPAARPLAAGDAEHVDANVGVEVTTERWVAARVSPAAAVTATGAELRLTGLGTAGLVRLELREDHDGLPAGRVLASGEAALPPHGSTAWVRVAFPERAVVPATDHWLTALASGGRALWMASPDGDGRWASRPRDHGAWAPFRSAGGTPGLGLLADRPPPTARPALQLTVEGALLPATRDGDRVSYDLKPAFAAGQALEATTLRIRVDAAGGSLSVDAPVVVYDVPP
jgi:hypothetical protein